MAKIFSRDVLESINLGSEQGSNDNPDYFVESTAWSDLIHDQADLILGRKGSGKTKLFRQLQKISYTNKRDLTGSISPIRTTVVPLISSHLDDEFRSLLQVAGDDEDLMKTGWLLQIAGLASVNLLRSPIESRSGTTKELNNIKQLKLFLREQSEQGNFLQFIGTQNNELKINLWKVVLKKLSQVKSVRIRPTGTIDQSGEFKVYPDIYLATSEAEDKELRATALNMLRSLNEVLTERQERFWVVVDSLDELLYGIRDQHSNAAVRSLLRAIIDIRQISSGLDFTNNTSLSLKVFARDDVIERMSADAPFPGLTTIQTSRISWTRREIAQMIKERLYSSELARRFYSALQLNNEPEPFVSQVFTGEHGRDFISQLIRETSDGANSASPRNIVGCLKRALDISKQEDHLGDKYHVMNPLVTKSNIDTALNQTSLARLDDTIKAEYPVLMQLIDRLRGAPRSYTSVQRMATHLGFELIELQHLLWWSDLAGLTERNGQRINVVNVYRRALHSTVAAADE